MYKKIAHIENESDYKDVIEELKDRFGPLPKCAAALLQVALIKAYACPARIKKVDKLKDEIRLFPNELNLNILLEISKMDRKNVLICGVGKTPYISVKLDTSPDFSSLAVKVLKKYKELLDKEAENNQ